ncbi:phosphinothricin N-acetyltransferase [Dokdonia pacifica]|uniref:Phosphinothricin acetyltransferase n=1 Tax=Dokdonia pacifica TaxID=1627892 RepID=A0A238WLZ4_9FLAO|nr:GNAT family N-acetyltransferase [Dokdonia pacifica]GGG22363.1 phosphinothricin N-acetyltransferase [Dokdonia pacifica]SNR47585.1 phosphinothricin acetyltransferase [Dokdonia pacifica]
MRVAQPDIQIRLFQKNDYSACAKIYKDGMDTGIATFETKVPDWDTWNAKFLKQCRFVAEANQTILGWCALTPFSSRKVYKGVAEVTIYVAKEAQQKGIGKLLLQHLIKESEKANFWTLQAKIFPENIASIKLHESYGFRKVGVRKKIAMRGGIWYDNVLLERRSHQIV